MKPKSSQTLTPTRIPPWRVTMIAVISLYLVVCYFASRAVAHGGTNPTGGGALIEPVNGVCFLQITPRLQS